MVIISEGMCYAKMPKKAMRRGITPEALNLETIDYMNQGELKARG